MPKQLTIGYSPPWKGNSTSATQEIARLLRNPDVPYHEHKIPPPVCILSQMSPVHIFSPYFFKIHSNIILSSTAKSSKLSLPFRFSDQISDKNTSVFGIAPHLYQPLTFILRLYFVWVQTRHWFSVS